MYRLLRGSILMAVALIVWNHPAHAEIVINEIMFNSAGPDTEYVEIINAGEVSVDLSGWLLKDDDDAHIFVLPTGSTLTPGGYLVFCVDTTAVTAKYGPGVSVVGNLAFNLSNSGDQVRIYDDLGALRDSLEYDDDLPWPPEADGDGPSLELLNPDYDNTLFFNWAASIDDYPEGTPGEQNSVYTEDHRPVVEDVQRDITLPANADEVTVTARVFDDFGLESVQLLVNVGGGFMPQYMFDDAAHGDGAAGDSVFGSIIPPHIDGTVVRYYVAATDNAQQLTLNPPRAPGDYYAYTVDYVPPDLVIHEVLAVNEDDIMDDFGEREDWIEILNRGGATVNLAGMFMSDSPDQSREWEFPEYFLGPGEFLLVWADDEPQQGPLHASFKLSAEGDEVVIFDQIDHGNVVIDMMTFGLQSADVSFGYYPEDTATAPEYLVEPTPGAPNAASVVFSPVCINEFLATSQYGGVDDWVELHNRGGVAVDISGWGITDDCDEPNRFTFPPSTVIQADSYLVLTEIDLGFAFASDGGEIIQLSLPDSSTGKDFYDFGPQNPDVSEGRYPNGVAVWHSFTTPTPGLPNADPSVDVEEPVDPVAGRAGLCILGVTPNPFRHTSSVRFDLPQAEPVSLSLFDAAGRLIRVLHEGSLQEGTHSVVWDGRNGAGNPAGSGVYFVRLENSWVRRTHSVILVR